MTRREMLAQTARLAGGAALISSTQGLVGQSQNADAPSLKSLVSRCGMNVGIAATKSDLADPGVARMVPSSFNMLTASGMKWARLHAQPDTFDFSEADWNMSFAERNGMKVHGHNLCWNSPQDVPAWLTAGANKGNARKILTDHIKAVAGRYKGKIDSWDVVNEPVVPWSTRADRLYPGLWVSMLGPEYIDIAFQTTMDVDPHALRVINVHHIEQGNSDDAQNRRSALDMLRGLVRRGVPVQAVGLESHLDAALPFDASAFSSFVKAIRDIGLQVLVTELDVQESRASSQPSAWDQGVAQRYAEYLDAVLPAAQPKTVIFWSLKDRWNGQKKVQGLLQNNLKPRISYGAVASSLSRGCGR